MNKTIIILVMILGILLVFGAKSSDSLSPVLSDIHGAIVSLGESEHDWYIESFEVSPAHNDSLFIVPEGRQFVIRRIYSAPELTLSLDWYLAADSNSILDGSINLVGTGPTGHIYSFKHDFPDLCLTIDSLETLNAVNNTDGPLGMTVIGYFRTMP